MSDNWITVIPEDPNFVPETGRREQARAWFSKIAPDAWEIELKVSEKIEFFDCGQNLERILCPSCHAEIPIEWWRQQMDEGYEHGFNFKKHSCPSCGAGHTLHDLAYDWPQGMGRFALDVMNPGIGKLNEGQRRELQDILGTPIRIIYQHI